ncbi:MAG: hypothetical protein ACFE95_20550 [Candidatus Hodarchaeota archaeon]
MEKKLKHLYVPTKKRTISRNVSKIKNSRKSPFSARFKKTINSHNMQVVALIAAAIFIVNAIFIISPTEEQNNGNLTNREINTGDDYVDNDASNVDSVFDKGNIIDFNNFTEFGTNQGTLVEENTGGASGQVAVDTVTTNSGDRQSFTHSHTISGINRLLVVSVQIIDTSVVVSSITYGGGSNYLTKVAEKSYDDSTSNKPRVEIWRLINPPTGIHNVVVTLSKAGKAAIGAISYTGVDQTTPIDGINSAQGKSTLPSVTVTSDTDDLVQDVMASDAGGQPTKGPEQTLWWMIPMGGSGSKYGVGSTEDGAPSVVMSWIIPESQEWVTIGFNIKKITYSSNYELDQEIQWISIDTNMSNYKLAIYCGTFNTTESIEVYIWDADHWILLFSDLTENKWNNITITSYINSIITIRFLGGHEIGDMEPSEWNIDACIIYGWTSDEYISTTLIADEITLTVEPGETANFTVMYMDFNQGSGIEGANLTYLWDYGSGQFVEEGDGFYKLTLNTSSLDEGTYYINVTASLENYEAKFLQISLVIITPKIGFLDQLLDYLPYIFVLILAAICSITVEQRYLVRKQEQSDREKIRRIMIVWESFTLYDQTPSEAVAEESMMDKDLVSGFFTAIKDITAEVSGTTLDTRKVYPNHPYYFVYSGMFYCVLILNDKPSPRLERKLLCFAKVVEEKYGENIKEQYAEDYASALIGVPEMQLDLDEEVMKIFKITPATALQNIITVSLSKEEIDKAKVSEDVKIVLMAGCVLTDQKEKFPLKELIRSASNYLGDIRTAHSAILEALEAGLITVLKKAEIPKEEQTLSEIKPELEIVEKVEEEKKEEKPPKKEKKKEKGEEFFENYYESTLSLAEIDLKKGIGKDEKIVLKYVKAFNEQVGLKIKGDTLIEGLKKEFNGDEKKAIKVLKKALKTGYLHESSGYDVINIQ